MSALVQITRRRNWRAEWSTVTTAAVLELLDVVGSVHNLRQIWATTRAAYGFKAIPAPLLSAGNAKLRKGSRAYAVGLSLLPANAGGFGTVCSHATGGPNGCAAACLNTSGHGVWPAVQRARQARTAFLASQPVAAAALVRAELLELLKRHERVAIRMNVFSDLAPGPWLTELLELESRLVAYDYSKNPEHMRLTDGVDRTYSISNRERSPEDVLELLSNRWRVAMVADVPKDWTPPAPRGALLVDADKHDERWTDPRPAVCVLRPKGDARKTAASSSGFVKPAAWLEELNRYALKLAK